MTFSDSLLNAIRTARQVAGVPVVYRRGEASVELMAVVGQTPTERDDGTGIVVRSKIRDYLIVATDLVLAGEQASPQKGDQIEETSGHVYEVMPVGSEPAWRYSGPGRDVFRVHTRLIDKP